MNVRDELKMKLKEKNNNELYISDEEKVICYKRMIKGYFKKNTVKRFMYQYIEAAGNELLGKFFNVSSSSRLTFELYSWMATDKDYLDIEFEYILPGIKTAQETPNMDVFFEKKDNIYFIENKFTEITYNDVYDIPEAYYKELGQAKSTTGYKLHSTLLYKYHNFEELSVYMSRFIKDMISYMEENNYCNKKDYFDVKQEISHLIGISLYILLNKKYVTNKTIHFYNVVYDFNEGKSELCNYFVEKAKELIEKVTKTYNINVLFMYDVIFVQDVIKYIPDNAMAFADVKERTAKEMLQQFFVQNI